MITGPRKKAAYPSAAACDKAANLYRRATACPTRLRANGPTTDTPKPPIANPR